MELTSNDFQEGSEIPKKFGYKHENEQPNVEFSSVPSDAKSLAIIMDDPDAMKAVGKIWVHWLTYHGLSDPNSKIEGKTDFGEIGYGGPAPPDGQHTYIFKGYALDTVLDLKEGYSKQELENAMEGHILDQVKLTGTFAP